MVYASTELAIRVDTANSSKALRCGYDTYRVRPSHQRSTAYMLNGIQQHERQHDMVSNLNRNTNYM